MSSYNTFNRHNCLKFSKESDLKPKNKILNINTDFFKKTNLVNNLHILEIGKMKKMKPKYKEFYKKLMNQKIIRKTQNNKNLESINLNKSNSSQNNYLRKNNSFLFNLKKIKTKDILFELEQLKYKIRLNHRKDSCSSLNKSNGNNYSYTRYNKSLHRNYNYNNINILLPNEMFKNCKKLDNIGLDVNNNISRNEIKDNNNFGNLITKSNTRSNKTQININENNLNIDEYKVTNNNNINTNNFKEEIRDKEELIKENKKLKKELEYSNTQLNNYKKYRDLYINLVNQIKRNKNLVKNIKINDINNKFHINNYVNELIERGN